MTNDPEHRARGRNLRLGLMLLWLLVAAAHCIIAFTAARKDAQVGAWFGVVLGLVLAAGCTLHPKLEQKAQDAHALGLTLIGVGILVGGYSLNLNTFWLLVGGAIAIILAYIGVRIFQDGSFKSPPRKSSTHYPRRWA